MQASSPQSADASGFGSDRATRDNRVIVLGASGFLGKHVCDRLRALSVDHLSVTRSPKPGYDAAVDLADAPQHELDDLIGSFRPTAVVNCAGAVSGTVDNLLRGNVVAVHALLMAMTNRAPTARLVQLGSSAEYGTPDQEAPMGEDIPTRPSNPYGIAKLASSKLVLRARAQGMTATVLRAFNVTGPQSPSSTMLGSFVEQLLDDPRALRLDFDSLTHQRDYVDVRDVATAACSAAVFAADPPAVANIGRGQAVHIGDLVRLLIEISGTGAKPEDTKTPRSTAKVSSSPIPWQCADVTTAKARLAWQPEISLSESLRDTWSAALRDSANY